MIESPMGGIYEAQAAVEPGESIVFKTMNLLSGSGCGPGGESNDTGGAFGTSVVEVLKPEFFIVAPEERSERYQHPIPRLKKDKVKRCYAHHGKQRIWVFGQLSWPEPRTIGHSFTFPFRWIILQIWM